MFSSMCCRIVMSALDRWEKKWQFCFKYQQQRTLYIKNLQRKFYCYIYLKYNKNKVVHMKNGLTRTQFFWSFIGRKSLIFFWLPLGRLECYSVIIFLVFCIYSVYPRFLRLRCGCLWFFFFLVHMVNSGVVFWLSL